MKIIKKYFRKADGVIQEHPVNIAVEVHDGVSAVYMNGVSDNVLDSEFGAGIEFVLEDLESWMADYRHSEYWCRPEFGTELSNIPDETQGLVYKKTDGNFGVVLPVVSQDYKCVLCGSEENTVTAKLFSWYEGLNYCKALAFLYAEGSNPYELLKKCAACGLQLLNTGCRTREERRYPEIFEYLGWCSWDAMEIRVNEEDLIKKCEEFQEKQIPVKWAIIDDMWAEVHDFYGVEYEDRTEMFQLMHSSKLFSFQADPKRFPNGLKHCIDQMKDYGLTVGMWHPSTGYWMGIDPEGDIFREYRDCLIQAENGAYVPSCEKTKSYAFYSAFHDYLRKAGAEFIKIDNQTMSRRFYKNIGPVGKVARDFHDGMEASVGQHFDNQMINCMGMGSEDMWNRSVSPISRCSDDFLPENREWFTKHILQCSYNCLVQGQFYYCDWDMWWTDDGQAVKNSVLRAISGGPIYVSDKLGRSNRDILDPLILQDGRILRCDKPAMPTKDCLTVNPVSSGKIFKLQNTCGDSGVLAVFNLDAANRKVCGTISPADLDGLRGDEFAVYEHFTRTLVTLKRNEVLEVTLANADEFCLYVVVPIKNGFAPIGLVDKFISPKTIASVDGKKITTYENGTCAYVENRVLKLCQSTTR